MTYVAPARLWQSTAAVLTGHAAADRVRRLAARVVRNRGAVSARTIIVAALPPVLIGAGWAIAQALQPASYSPARQSVSVLAGYAARDRQLMTWAIFLAGCCYLLTAAGLHGTRLPARLTLLVAGVAGIGIAASPEPAHGSTPQHMAWTALGAVAIALWPISVAPIATGQRHPHAARPALGRCTSLAIIIAFACLLVWLVVETHHGQLLGLAERVAVEVQTSWPCVIAITLWRRSARSTPGTTADTGRSRSRPGLSDRHPSQLLRSGSRTPSSSPEYFRGLIDVRLPTKALLADAEMAEPLDG